MFYSPKHAQTKQSSPARRRIAGVAVAGATATVGTIASAQGASAATTSSVWDAVAQCESGGNWSINTGNGFYGGLQFTTQTWNGFGGGKYAPNAHQATKAQQIEIAQKVLATQGPGAWPVCSQKAGLTQANGGAAVASTPEPAPAPAPAPKPAQQTEQQAPQTASRSEVRTPAATGAGLAVDGIRGPKTNAAIEKWVGAQQDGNLSVDDIKALQGEVGTAQDGIIGPKTTGALQSVVGATQDGIWGPKTTAALQTYLNGR